MKCDCDALGVGVGVGRSSGQDRRLYFSQRVDAYLVSTK